MQDDQFSDKKEHKFSGCIRTTPILRFSEEGALRSNGEKFAASPLIRISPKAVFTVASPGRSGLGSRFNNRFQSSWSTGTYRRLTSRLH